MGRGRDRPARRLDRTAEDSADEGGDGVASRADVGDSDGPVGEIGGLLVASGGTSSARRRASFTGGLEVTYRAEREVKTNTVGKIEDKMSRLRSAEPSRRNQANQRESILIKTLSGVP